MRGTLWNRDDQTQGKHLILEAYLQGWFPILGNSNSRILFIDGFAGPGEYRDGGIGSPIVALECIRLHRRAGRLANTEAVCLFIEQDNARVAHLRALLAKRDDHEQTKILIREGTFEDNVGELLDYLDEQKRRLAPAFVMIDPFGVKGIPMRLVERILANRRSECFISFMDEPMRRWHDHPAFERPLTELFGTAEWKQCLTMPTWEQKRNFLHALYNQQLKSHGAQYVVQCQLWNGNRHIYTVYFATGHEKGCDLMKQAIWKAVPDGSFQFRGYNQHQPVLFSPEVDTSLLATQLQEKFGDAPTAVETIEQFVMSDETVFHTGHLRQKTLQPLEKQGRIVVNRPSGGRGFSKGRGITVRFVDDG